MEIQIVAQASPTNGETRLRVRAGDPLSSLHAADNAALFAGAHKERISAALDMLGSGTAHEIANATGLTVVQVDRRLPELKRDGVARVLEAGGQDVMRGGFRVWVLEKNLTAAQQDVAGATFA